MSSVVVGPVSSRLSVTVTPYFGCGVGQPASSSARPSTAALRVAVRVAGTGAPQWTHAPGSERTWHPQDGQGTSGTETSRPRLTLRARAPYARGMLLWSVAACVYVPEPPPATRPPPADSAAEPSPTTGGFDDCFTLRSARVVSGEGADAGALVAPAPGGGSFVAVRHDEEITLGSGDAAVRVTPLGEWAWAVARLDGDGAPAWVTSLQGTSQIDVDALAAAPDGAVYVAGAGDALSALGDGPPLGERGEADAFVARLGPDGAVAWVLDLGSPAEDAASGVAVLADGDVVAAGTLGATGTLGAGRQRLRVSVPPNAASTAWLARLSAAGEVRWVTAWGGAEITRVTGLAPDPGGGGVVLAGEVEGDGETTFGAAGAIAPPPEDAGFVVRVDGDGRPTSLADLGGVEVGPVVVAPDGDAWVVGALDGPATFGRGEPGERSFSGPVDGLRDGWVARFAPDGALRAVQVTAADPEGDAVIEAVAADGAGVLVAGSVLAGATIGPTRVVPLPDARDGFLARVTADGEWGCGAVVPALNPLSDVLPAALGSRGGGGATLIGTFLGSARFGAGAALPVDAAAVGAYDAFLLEVEAR